MLTKADDYPIHQTPEPIAYTGATRNFYDRYFFNGYHLHEDVFFAAALGVYPYLNVIDAALSVIVDGTQYNLLGSRTLHMERMDTQVGPVRIEVVEPLQRLRLVVDDADRDIRADLLFTGRAPAQEEPRFTRRVGTHLVMDYTRLTQNGVWEGALHIAGRDIAVTDDLWRGTRDRSWGVRNIGAADAQPNPYALPVPQFYWLWAPVNWDDGVSLYHLNDDDLGRPWNTDGVWVPLSGQGETRRMQQVKSKLSFISGTRHAQRAEIEMTDHEGTTQIVMEPRFHWYMKGVGYGHERFAHGSYHGELETMFESYPLTEVDDAKTLHIQALCDVTMEGHLGARRGRGVLEQLIIGPHAPSGFEALMDMAP